MNSKENIEKTTSVKHLYEKEVVPLIPALNSFALKMTGNEDDANDLVQETLLKAYRYFDKYELGTNCKSWLFTIMRNTFINIYRKNSREPNKVDYEDVQNFYENIKPSEINDNHFVEDVFSNLLDDEITQAIADLSEDFRTVIILSDIEGFTYEEIAEFINSPIGTVRSRLHRARKMLYTKLKEYAVSKGYLREIPAVRAISQNLNPSLSTI